MSDESWIAIYWLGAVLNIILFFLYRLYIKSEARCHWLWYIPISLLSFTMTLLAFAALVREAVKYSRENR